MPSSPGRLTSPLKGAFDAMSALAAAEPTGPVAPIGKTITFPSLLNPNVFDSPFILSSYVAF